MIEECVYKIVMKKGGCDNELKYKSGFKIDVKKMIDYIVEKYSVEDESKVEEMKNKMEEDIEIKKEEEEKIENEEKKLCEMENIKGYVKVKEGKIKKKMNVEVVVVEI